MISLGSLVKSLTGTGIFLVIYSHTTSMLYLSWAEMGMMYFLVILQLSFLWEGWGWRGLCRRV